MFVDGENFTIEGQKFATAANLTLFGGKHWKEDVYLWFPGLLGRQTSFISAQLGRDVNETAVRAHYYTSVSGNEEVIRETERALWALEFHAEVFKKPQGERAKRVDITLARDMLSHAYQHHYDIAVLIAGDGDYVPLVDAVKKNGKMVVVAFFGGRGLNESLKLAADNFFDLSPWFTERWELERDERAAGPS